MWLRLCYELELNTFMGAIRVAVGLLGHHGKWLQAAGIRGMLLAWGGMV